MKTAEEIIEDKLIKFSGEFIATKLSALRAMKEIAEIAFDAGVRRGFAEGSDIEIFSQSPNKEQFLNDLFKQE